MQIPIACRLTETAAEVQLGEWRDVLAASVVATERISPTALSLRLADDLTQLDTLVRLAQREKACCPFFEFTLRIDADAVTLGVSVPAGAESILDDFAPSSG